jgi:hypothetical protein
MHGIAFDTRPSYPFRTSSFRIRGNKIGKHTDEVDIYIYNTPQKLDGKSASGFDSKNNLIYNNNRGKATIGAQGGIIYSTTP